MLAADLNWEGSMTFHQRTEKMLTVYHKVPKKKVASTVQITLGKIYEESTLILSVSNVTVYEYILVLFFISVYICNWQ